jgi:hypothetical protein
LIQANIRLGYGQRPALAVPLAIVQRAAEKVYILLHGEGLDLGKGEELAGPSAGKGNLSPASLIRFLGSAIGQHLSPMTTVCLYIWIRLNLDEKINYVSPNGGNGISGDGASRLYHHDSFWTIRTQH